MGHVRLEPSFSQGDYRTLRASVGYTVSSMGGEAIKPFNSLVASLPFALFMCQYFQRCVKRNAYRPFICYL